MCADCLYAKQRNNKRKKMHIVSPTLPRVCGYLLKAWSWIIHRCFSGRLKKVYRKKRTEKVVPYFIIINQNFLMYVVCTQCFRAWCHMNSGPCSHDVRNVQQTWIWSWYFDVSGNMTIHCSLQWKVSFKVRIKEICLIYSQY